mmetsp:Transcript_10860/g.25255  ORF Transcript_10860/g.25255 Transcript_10860/m.25255 type:complete len:261 (-) Transcript_10860:188-970(-)
MRRSVFCVTRIAQMQRFYQIFNAFINETARNEELEYLGGERRDVPDKVDNPRDGSDEVEQRRPNAKPPKEAPVIRFELAGEIIARAEQDGDGPRDSQKRQGLPANYRVNYADDSSRKQRLGRGEVAKRLRVHQFRENQGGDELDHESEDNGVDDSEEAPRLAPVGRVIREEARAEVRPDAREKLKEAVGPAVIARVGTRRRRSHGLRILVGGCDGLHLVILLVDCHLLSFHSVCLSRPPTLLLHTVSTVGRAGQQFCVRR